MPGYVPSKSSWQWKKIRHESYRGLSEAVAFFWNIWRPTMSIIYGQRALLEWRMRSRNGRKRQLVLWALLGMRTDSMEC